MKNNTNYSCLTIWKKLCVDTIFKMAAVVAESRMSVCCCCKFGLFGQNKWCSMGENAFHMVFQEIWVFSHSSPNPALAATRLWAGYGELVGENSISPGKPCEMHIRSASVPASLGKDALSRAGGNTALAACLCPFSRLLREKLEFPMLDNIARHSLTFFTSYRLIPLLSVKTWV